MIMDKYIISAVNWILGLSFINVDFTQFLEKANEVTNFAGNCLGIVMLIIGMFVMIQNFKLKKQQKKKIEEERERRNKWNT